MSNLGILKSRCVRPPPYKLLLLPSLFWNPAGIALAHLTQYTRAAALVLQLSEQPHHLAGFCDFMSIFAMSFNSLNAVLMKVSQVHFRRWPASKQPSYF